MFKNGEGMIEALLLVADATGSLYGRLFFLLFKLSF
jgi:hypothetical protein